MNDNSPAEPRPVADEPVAAAPAAASPGAASPGSLLRQARERAGLGVDDLAAQTKLAKGTLEALERDDFAMLSEAVYVRGYYRRISKVLPVAEAELLDAYAARVQPKSLPPLPRIPLAGGVSAGASRSYRNQWIGGVGVAALALVLVFLFSGPRPSAPPAASRAPTPAEPATPAPEMPAPATGEAVPPPAATGAPQGAPTPAPAVPAAAPVAATPVPAVPNQLLMEFGESSFVRVEDSRSKTLAIGLVRGGERQALDGQPPYTVFLGNAQHVKVYFGGAPVDFAAHVNAQNDTARFTVP